MKGALGNDPDRRMHSREPDDRFDVREEQADVRQKTKMTTNRRTGQNEWAE